MTLGLGTLLCLFAWCTALAWPLIGRRALTTDEHVYLLAGRALRRGQLYREVWDVKPPGVYLVAAAALATPAPGLALRLISLAFVAVTGLALGQLTGSTFPLWIYALTVLRWGGAMINAEVFYNLLLLVAYTSMVQGRVWVSGLAWGVAFQFKYSVLPHGVALFLLALGCGVLPWTLGAVLPSLLVVAWLARARLLSNFWDATLRANLAYSSGRAKLVQEIGNSSRDNWALHLLLHGPLWLAAMFSYPGTELWVQVWLLAALAEVLWQGSMWSHYFNVLLPPLVLMGSAHPLLGWLVAPVILAGWARRLPRSGERDSCFLAQRWLASRLRRGEQLLCIGHGVLALSVGLDRPPLNPYLNWLGDERYREILGVSPEDELRRTLAKRPEWIAWRPHDGHPDWLRDTLEQDYRCLQEFQELGLWGLKDSA